MQREREFSAGGLVYKKEGDQVFWLIRRAKGGGDYRGNLGWSFPKGWIEKRKWQSEKRKIDETESPEEAALREVEEEGGVKAKIVTKLPTIKFFYTNPQGQKVMKFVTYFAMEWLEDLKEGFGPETEETKWVTKDEAQILLVHQNEKELLEQAAAILGKWQPLT